MKRRLHTPLIFSTLVAALAIFIAAPPSALSQTITITTIEELQKIGNDAGYPLDGNYTLGSDIDASATVGWNGGEGFEPIGSTSSPFGGSFDGRGYAITDLFINRPAAHHIGLFAYAAGSDAPATISNIALERADITGNNYVGALVGLKDNCLIYNSYSTGRVLAQTNYAGGLLGGSQANTPISNCYSTCSVTGQLGVGGLIGGIISLTGNCLVKNCYSTGKVTAVEYGGGLVGWSRADAQIENCYSTSPVTGQLGIGGLVGYSESSSITTCYSAGSVSITENRDGSLIGGLIGLSTTATATDCFWDSTTSGQLLSDGGIGKSTEDMKARSTFTDAGWDFTSVWGIVESSTYPFFRGENNLPVASPDSYNANTNEMLTVEAPGVLANDVDTDGDELLAILVSEPSHGAVTLETSGAFTYTPDDDFDGTDNFTYKVKSGADNTTAVLVTLIVGNTAPSATDDDYTVYRNMQLYEARPGVLGNDSDPNNDKLAAVLVTPPEHGTLNLHESGWFIYRPDRDFIGTDTFTYSADDGEFSTSPATVTIEVEQFCPSVFLYGENSSEVETLRRYRDEVLALSATGRAATNFYYRMAPLMEIMLKNSSPLQQLAKNIINCALPLLRKRLLPPAP